MNHLRFQPEPWMTHMITTRCLEGQGLMTPTPHTTQIITGCFAYALRRYTGRVKIHHVVALSNHYHALISAESQYTLSSFMGLLNGSLAKELALINGAGGHIWHRRYAKHLLLDDIALRDAYRYLFANSVKEGLVAHPRDWIGLHGYQALCEGRALRGIWVDRTRLSRARQVAKIKGLTPPSELDFTEELPLTLEPPPSWSHLTPDELSASCRGWADEVANEHSTRRAINREGVIGAEGVLREDPRKRRSVRKSPRPLCRSGCPARYAHFLNAYYTFAGLYQEASARLRRGLRTSGTSPVVNFPPGGVPLFGGH